MKIKEQAEALRRTYPNISAAYSRYMLAQPSDFKRRGKSIVLWAVFWSDDGRVSLHQTEFARDRSMTAIEWAGWLQVNMPAIMVNSVLAYMNRSFGSTWNVDRVFGWHFAGRKARR